MNENLTSVLVLHYGEPSLTNHCLRSVAQNDDHQRTMHILVIDNSETQDFSLSDAGVDANIQILRTGANLGYAGGMNRGIQAALQSHSRFLFLLNNDVTMMRGCIKQLTAFMGSNEHVGIVSPLILYKKNIVRIWATGSRVYFPVGRAIDPYHDRFYRPDLLQPIDVDSVTGCAMMVRREVFKQVGTLDENYFSYYEDVDFCHRARLFGYKIYCYPLAKVFHRVSGSLRSKAPFRRQPHYFMIRNRIYFMRKYSRRAEMLLFSIWLSLELTGKILLFTLLLKIRKLAAYLLGVYDAFRPVPTQLNLQSPGKISACIITKNAEKTIERCLLSLNGVVDEIVIVDSGSTDSTVMLCQKYTDCIHRTKFYGDFSKLRNQVSQYAQHPWILALDADEYLSEELRINLSRLTSDPRYKGYYFRRINYYGDKIISYGFLRFDLLLRLYQKEGSFFHGKVHEQVMTAGENKKTPYVLFHRQGVNNFTYHSFITKWRGYLDIEAREKAEKSKKKRRWLYLFLGPVGFYLVFFRDLLLLFGILDGIKGIKIAYFRALYIYELYLAIFRKLS